MITSTTTGTLGALNATVTMSADVADRYSVQVTGTWAGTITFECSVDGTNWVSEAVVSSASTAITTGVTTTTTNGVWSSDAYAIPYVRVKMTAYTSGTATVTFASARTSK